MLDDKTVVRFYVSLTPRQREVLKWVSTGLRNREVAAKLYIEPCVVAGHLTNIFEELMTVEGIEGRPNRLVLIRLFAGFFDRHPELDVTDDQQQV